MSRWTHIVAAIDVDTYMRSHTIADDVRELLKWAPQITGSEEDAEVFVNALGGYNLSSWSDGVRENYQTRVVITVIGDLRDKTGKETEKEWSEFKTFIEKLIDGEGWGIRNCTCKIVDEYEEMIEGEI